MMSFKNGFLQFFRKFLGVICTIFGTKKRRRIPPELLNEALQYVPYSRCERLWRKSSNRLLTILSLKHFCKLDTAFEAELNQLKEQLASQAERIQYLEDLLEQKVDPNLKVEMKQQWGKKQTQQNQHKYAGHFTGPGFQSPPQHPRPLKPIQRDQEMMDDKHVLHKLQQIQLSVEEVRNAERLAIFVEKTLKKVSDLMVNESGCETKAEEEQRVLKGVIWVGLLAKHLLLKSDTQIELVVLCSKIPTVTLLKQVAEYFKKYAELETDEQLTLTENAEDAAIMVSLSTVPLNCRVTLTCVLIREAAQPNTTASSANETSIQEEKPPVDALPKGPCLNALAELRHAKFYQVKCTPLHSMNSTMKIIRDIGNRVRIWSSLNCWAIELLIEKTLSSTAMELSPGDAVRRLFEVISSGQYLSKRSKLVDPCEKEPVDVLGHITDQEREDITSSAQHALRLIAYNQIYKILGIERLPDAATSSSGFRNWRSEKADDDDQSRR